MISINTPLILASAGWAFVYWVCFARGDASSWAKSTIKTLPVLTLAIVGVFHLLLAPQGFWVIPLGLALGALGDLLLSRPSDRAFLAGMAAFAAGHLAYVAGFWGRGGTLTGWEWAALAVVAALILSTEV